MAAVLKKRAAAKFNEDNPVNMNIHSGKNSL